MTVSLQILKTDEIAMLIEKYEIVIMNMSTMLETRV